MSFYRNQLENYLRQLHINADVVIDIGGGAWPVKDRVSGWNVGKYIIYDKGIEDAKPDILTIDYDLNEENYQENSNIPRNREADMVFCLEVFEYIWNPVQATKNIFNLLRDGGRAFITFPFVYPQHEPIEYDFLRYTAQGVMTLLQKAGFEAENIKIIPRVDKSKQLRIFYAEDGMHPSKRLSTHDATGWIVEVKK